MKTIIINDKEYTIKSIGEVVITLAGPRGGYAQMVKNIHTGTYIFQAGRNGEPINTGITEII